MRVALRELLPDFMIPSAVVKLGCFPLTPSGKLDRENLRRRAASLMRRRGSSPGPRGAGVPRNRIQKTLLDLFREVLKQDSIGIDDDFFLLGGDSLAAVDLLHRVEKELQYQLPFTLLMEAPSVAQLEARLERSTQGAVNDVISVHAGGKQRPLFALCGRYGHVLRLLPLLRSLDKDQPSYGLQPPGMDWGSVGCTTIPQMAAHYLATIKGIQAQGPYRLLGTSFGGVVAYEIALQLQAQGESVEFLGLVDTNPPPCLLPGSDYLPPPPFDEEVPQEYEPESIEAKNQRLADMHERARGQYLLNARSRDHLFRGALTYFYCTANPIVAKNDPRRLWKYLAPGRFRLLSLSGPHGSLHKEPQASALQHLLQCCLDQVPLSEADPAVVFDESLDLKADDQHEQIISSCGAIYEIKKGSDQGLVQALKRRGEAIKILGWAVEPCRKQPAKKIAVFCDGRFLGCGASGVPKAGTSVPYSGFIFDFRHVERTGYAGQLRLFVLSDAGRAAELPWTCP